MNIADSRVRLDSPLRLTNSTEELKTQAAKCQVPDNVQISTFFPFIFQSGQRPTSARGASGSSASSSSRSSTSRSSAGQKSTSRQVKSAKPSGKWKP